MMTTVVVIMIAAAVGLFLYLLSYSAGQLTGQYTVSEDADVTSTGTQTRGNGDTRANLTAKTARKTQKPT